MRAEREYDFHMRRLNVAWVAVFAVVVSLMPGATASAQINGVPSSVTSIGFGGQGNRTPGVPASVTSLGPNGFQPRNPFMNQPACCFNPLFPINQNPPAFSGRHHHHQGNGLPVGGYLYGSPYSPVIVEQPVVAEDEVEEDEYKGGPTIFDRRGPGTGGFEQDPREQDRREQSRGEQGRREQGRRERDYDRNAFQEPVAQAEPAPVASQPETLLVFKDGHEVEVENYAIVGDTLFDLSGGHRRKIALAQLDLAATSKQNDDRGIDFAVPAGFGTN